MEVVVEVVAEEVVEEVMEVEVLVEVVVDSAVVVEAEEVVEVELVVELVVEEPVEEVVKVVVADEALVEVGAAVDVVAPVDVEGLVEVVNVEELVVTVEPLDRLAEEVVEAETKFVDVVLVLNFVGALVEGDEDVDDVYPGFLAVLAVLFEVVEDGVKAVVEPDTGSGMLELEDCSPLSQSPQSVQSLLLGEEVELHVALLTTVASHAARL